MTITLPTVGQANWDVPLDEVMETFAQTAFNPNDHGLLVWNYDATQISSSNAPTSGQLRLVRLPAFPRSVTVTSLAVHIGVAPVGLTAGQNFLGLYSAAGNLLAQTASAATDTAFGTTGAKVIALTAPYVAAAGTYYVGILANAATSPPQFSICSTFSASAINFNLSTATSRYLNGPTAQTVLPASVTMASQTASLNATWVGAA